MKIISYIDLTKYYYYPKIRYAVLKKKGKLIL